MTPTPHRQCFWLGGSPCSGKSTISARLKDRLGLAVYHVDDEFGTHLTRIDPLRHPAFTRWLKSTWDERWMQPADALLHEAIACYTEHFSLVQADVLALDPPLLVEGTALLPGLAADLGVDHDHALWLLPSADFQREHYAKREFIKGILAECSAPDAAFENWMQRDIAFARWTASEAKRCHYPYIIVDGSEPIEAVEAQVIAHFRLG